jgi:hypothetical protein
LSYLHNLSKGYLEDVATAAGCEAYGTNREMEQIIADHCESLANEGDDLEEIKWAAQLAYDECFGRGCGDTEPEQSDSDAQGSDEEQDEVDSEGGSDLAADDSATSVSCGSRNPCSIERGERENNYSHRQEDLATIDRKIQELEELKKKRQDVVDEMESERYL